MESLQGVPLERRDKAKLTARILERALTEVGRTGPQTIKIGQYVADEESLRDGLEETYRRLASTESDEQRRYALVDQANAVRRWTLQ